MTNELNEILARAVTCEDPREFMVDLIERAKKAGITEDGRTLTEAVAISKRKELIVSLCCELQSEYRLMQKLVKKKVWNLLWELSQIKNG